jgi:hypothetical protein
MSNAGRATRAPAGQGVSIAFTVVIDRDGRLAAQIRGESAVRRLPAILDRLAAPRARR